MAGPRSRPVDADAAGLEEVACEVARAAGRLVVEERPEELGVSSKSTRTDPVTEMDQRSQELLVHLLGERRPDDGVLGEEEGGVAGSSGITWVVDPIDGTVNYVYGIPAFAVSVAAVTGDATRPGAWRAVAGAVLNPVTGELFHAHRGGGARLTSAAAPVWCAPRRRPTSAWRSSGPASATTRGCARDRQPSSSTCSRWCATSGGRAARPSTCARSPAGGSTPTTRRVSTRGTARPVSSWPPRPARWSADPARRAPTGEPTWAAAPGLAAGFAALVQGLTARHVTARD